MERDPVDMHYTSISREAYQLFMDPDWWDEAATILEIDGQYTRGKRTLKGLESTFK